MITDYRSKSIDSWTAKLEHFKLLELIHAPEINNIKPVTYHELNVVLKFSPFLFFSKFEIVLELVRFPFLFNFGSCKTIKMHHKEQGAARFQKEFY